MNTNIVVSLTSHGSRLSYVGVTLYSLLCAGIHTIVLTVYKDDIKNIPNDVLILIKSGLVKLIIAPENYGPHLKYYYCMKHYKSNPIITVDDDAIYTKDMINSLINEWHKYPLSIICRRAHYITFEHNKIAPYDHWHHEISAGNDSRYIFATGVGGVLYPPNILDIDSIDAADIKKCLWADDIFLKVIENRRNINIHIVPCKNKLPQAHTAATESNALCKKNVTEQRNDKYIQQFAADLK